MRFRLHTTGYPSASKHDADATERVQSYPVRLSILTWERLVVILLVAVGGFLVSMTDDGTTEGDPARQSLRGHDALLERLVYAEDGRTLISCGWDRQVRFWDLAGDQRKWGRELDRLPQNWPILALAITDDGKNLAAGGPGGFTIWTRESMNRTWKLTEEHSGGSFRCLAASPDNRTFAFGGSDGVIRLWDVQARQEMSVPDPLGDSIKTIEFSPSGSFLAASAFSGEFRVWDLKSAAQPRALAVGPVSVQSFAFAPDDRALAVAQLSERATTLGLWDLRTGNRLLPPTEYMAGNNTLAFSADGRVMASADQDLTIRFWDTRTGELEETFHDGVGWVKTLAFSPDGRQIAFGGNDGSIHFHNLTLKGQQPAQTHSS